MDLKKIEETIFIINNAVNKISGSNAKIKKSRDLTETLLMPLLKPLEIEGMKYYQKREEYNKKLDKIAKSVFKLLEKETKSLDFKFEIKFMSSYNSKLNLIGDSDIDIGFLVRDLDMDKLFKITMILNRLGFMATGKKTNKNYLKASYYSYEKMIGEKEKIEIEFKIRDLEGSKAVTLLHERLNNDLSKKERIIWTWLKKLSKDIAKKDKTRGEFYKRVKQTIYNYYFYGIKNAYYLEL
jgi:hypothetical protein